MSYLNQPQDASMEDILSSIRKILDEDPKSSKKAPAKKKEEPLELTEVVEESVKKSPSIPELKTEEPAPSSDTLMSSTALSASVAALSSLKQAVAPSTHASTTQGQTTIEDIAKSLLMPLLKDWINQNLPSLVEKIVKEEVQRLTQRVS
jgi:cell pole-organizing protein PopZ